MIGSDWYGIRKLIPSTSASEPSNSGAVEAPVKQPIMKSSPRVCASEICFARATGVSLG